MKTKNMKRYYLVVFFLLTMIGAGYAQVETHYYQDGETSHNPWHSVRRNMDVKRMPSFDLAQLQREDVENDNAGRLFRFGKGFDVSYTLADGQWEDVGGGRLWAMTFISEGALSLNFVFNDFRLPEGAELYIENEDKTVLYGPVTSEATTENGYFLTDIIPGSQATIYLFEPSWCENESSLTIKRVVHGYRDGGLQLSQAPIGRPYIPHYYTPCYPNYEMEANGIGLVLSSSGTSLCSGALIMSTDFSFKSYFLTVYDLVDMNEDGTITDTELSFVQNCSFKFHFKLTECQGSSNTVSYTYNHATFRAAWNTTKFALLEITGSLKNNQNLTWLGWDCSGTQPTSTTCLFYPPFVPVAIIFDYDSPSSNGNALGNHGWKSMYELGVPESGISGAPLLNQNKKVVGQIYSFGYNTDYPQIVNHTEAGKLSESWIGGGTYNYNKNLGHWLSPNSGQLTMNSYRAMIIKGPNKIISSATYHLQNLPNGMTVHWSLNDSYYSQNCMTQNINANWCTITRVSGHELTNATLTAYVYQGNQVICSFTKMISTGNGFDGTYYNGQTTVPIDLPSPLYVLPGTLVTITSPNLVGATVTQNGGNATPTSWTFNSSTGVLKVGMPSSTGMAVVVKATCSGGAVYNLPITTTNNPTYFMYLSMSGSNIQVSFTPNESSEASLARSFSDKDKKEWTLKAYNSMTGEKVFEKVISDQTYSINTIGWKPGVYVINAVVDKEIYSEKIVVK